MNEPTNEVNQEKNPEQESLRIQAVNIFKRTLPKMTVHEIPTTPENYAVWYKYSTGHNKELNEEIEKLIVQGNAAFTLEINQQLYDTYVADKSQEVMENVQTETKQLVESLLLKLSGMREGTQKFSGSLNKSQEILKKQPDINTINLLVSSLIDEAAAVEEANTAMEKTLSVMSQEVEYLKQDMLALSKTAYTDQLTGISNRRAFDDRMQRLFKEYREEEQIFSLLIMDIDHFKQFNDTWGHAVGDKVLMYVANALKNSIKGQDMAARYGDEEFVIMLPETPYNGAIAVAENIRKKIAQKSLTTGGATKKTVGKVTISIGVATVRSNDDVESIIERADKGLYRAKNTGRNRVIGEQDMH